MSYSPVKSELSRDTKFLVEYSVLELTDQPKPHKNKSSIRTICTKFFPETDGENAIGLSLATIGPGILTLPYAFAQCGLILGLIQIAVCAALGCYAMNLLTKCCAIAKKSSYSELALSTFGSKFHFFIKAMFMLNNWGTLVLYTLVASSLFADIVNMFIPQDTLPQYILEFESLFWPLVFTTFIVAPLCTVKTLPRLRYSNFVCLFLAFFLVVLIVYKCFETGSFTASMEHVRLLDFGNLKNSFPLIVFNYAFQSNIPSAVHNLEGPTGRSVNSILKRFLITASVIYAIIGLFGYMLFAGDLYAIHSFKSIAESFEYKGWFVSAGITIFLVGASISLAMAYLIQLCKDELRNFLYTRGLIKDKTMFFGGWIKQTSDKYNIRDLGLLLVIIVSQLLCALYVQKVIEVLDLLGAITLPLLAYNIPCLFYLKLDKSSFRSKEKLKCLAVNVMMIGLCGFYTYIYFTTTQESWKN